MCFLPIFRSVAKDDFYVFLVYSGGEMRRKAEFYCFYLFLTFVCFTISIQKCRNRKLRIILTNTPVTVENILLIAGVGRVNVTHSTFCLHFDQVIVSRSIPLDQLMASSVS